MSLLIAACATAPVPTRPTPGVLPAATQAPGLGTTPAVSPPPAPARPDVWQRLRGSFAMDDCAADPGIDTWARRYTRSPKRFEAQLHSILPRLVYVQESAARHGVAGEFALLPWVESHFEPVPPNRQRAAGMWQIMPGTARHMGLAVERGYDGRLDLLAATDGVMTLLSHYHDRFHDWRLADYAYNAGRFGIARLVARHGVPPAEPAIPTLPVRAGTRQHLTKLLAIACVVREPQRFGITLPTLDADQQLVDMRVNQRLSLDMVAQQAGMPRATLAGLNASYRDGVVDTSRGGHLLLPRGHAEQLRIALLAQAVGGPDERMASVSAAPRLPDLGDNPPPATSQSEHIPATPAVSAAPAPARVHVVKPGDTLSGIAHNYHVHIAQLKRWNHLHGNTIRAGQKLAVSTPG
jgi:membrane-bound lytic murein transglycosylase D